MDLLTIISFEPLTDCNTSLTPLLYLSAATASLITFSSVLIVLHLHVKVYHSSADGYSSTYYNVFCHSSQCFNLPFKRCFGNCWHCNFKCSPCKNRCFSSCNSMLPICCRCPFDVIRSATSIMCRVSTSNPCSSSVFVISLTSAVLAASMPSICQIS